MPGLSFEALSPNGLEALYDIPVATVDPTIMLTSDSAMDRMFNSALGGKIAKYFGSESYTLSVCEYLALEILAEALVQSGVSLRMVLRPSRAGMPPVLSLLAPAMENVDASRLITDAVDLPPNQLLRAARQLGSFDEENLRLCYQNFVGAGAAGMTELFAIARPEILLTRHPKMEPACVCDPKLTLDQPGDSTAGVLCTDIDGELGVTACYHGTGDPGTKVSIMGQSCVVKHASQVQDTVFIPIDPNLVPANMAAKGVLDTKGPQERDEATFDGLTSGLTTTKVQSKDRGITRKQPHRQLCIQTDADLNRGDSGCALLDEAGMVMGFGFQVSGPNEEPAMADWIWAANALNALDLIPVTQTTP
ncbi:MAG: hypothetical protein HKN30_17995 [Sulfitobacter sp.]|nr:hypothetical protein [Sulfitobacter sp.]